jgi:hypothetical protein
MPCLKFLFHPLETRTEPNETITIRSDFESKASHCLGALLTEWVRNRFDASLPAAPPAIPRARM